MSAENAESKPNRGYFEQKYEIKSQIYVAKRERQDIIKIEWRVKRYVMSVYCEELQEYKR